jgi:hypothetical protein
MDEKKAVETVLVSTIESLAALSSPIVKEIINRRYPELYIQILHTEHELKTLLAKAECANQHTRCQHTRQSQTVVPNKFGCVCDYNVPCPKHP